MPTFLLSTVGTSILTNKAPATRDLVFKHANATSLDDIDPAARQALQQRIAEVKASFAAADEAFAADQSAELNGILKWHRASGHPADVHLLLHSDTALGKATGEIAADWLRRNGMNVSLDRAAELQTDDPAAFRRAMAALAMKVSEQAQSYRAAGYHVVFNLVGGFKGPNGFLHSIGALYADEVVYLFESSKQLMRVPRLPVAIDTDKVLAALPAWRKHHAGLHLEPDELDPMFIDELDGLQDAAPFGAMIMAPVQAEAYQGGVLPSPFPRVRFGPSFSASLGRLPARRLVQINERIDDLAKHTNDRGYNPGRLDVKGLRAEGQAKHRPATHECDAWNDEDGKRIFFHYEGEGQERAAVLDHLATGLH
jgi:putative CRISPR-associated protein (TIGR02619 family)